MGIRIGYGYLQSFSSFCIPHLIYLSFYLFCVVLNSLLLSTLIYLLYPCYALNYAHRKFLKWSLENKMVVEKALRTAY